MATFTVSITRVTYYRVTATDAERAVDLALRVVELGEGETVAELDEETTGHQVEEQCEHDYHTSRYCGARVCDGCGDHQGLERCFCGWSRSGGDGRRELLEMGETIEPEE